MKPKNHYTKNKPTRTHKVTSINIDFELDHVIKKNNLSLSGLVRDLLTDYMLQNYAADLKAARQIELEKNE